MTAAAVATAALRELDDILDPIRKPGRADIEIPELDTPPPGGPRTFMILGSDKREGADRYSPPRSDTILLARADPDTDAITVMSIPRDLKVDIPGHGTEQDQRRVRARRPQAAARRWSSRRSRSCSATRPARTSRSPT